MGRLLAYEEALASMEKAVAEKGKDFVYKKERDRIVSGLTEEGVTIFGNHTCYYELPPAEGEEPVRCIAGEVIHDLVTEEEWEVIIDFMHNQLGFPELVEQVLRKNYGISDELMWAIRSAQRKQDGGGTWGEALEDFKKSYAAYEDNIPTPVRGVS